MLKLRHQRQHCCCYDPKPTNPVDYAQLCTFPMQCDPHLKGKHGRSRHEKEKKARTPEINKNFLQFFQRKKATDFRNEILQQSDRSERHLLNIYVITNSQMNYAIIRSFSEIQSTIETRKTFTYQISTHQSIPIQKKTPKISDLYKKSQFLNQSHFKKA